MASQSKKTVLITGVSAGGIGSALAFAFHARGLRVFAAIRNEKKLDPKLAPLVEVVALDVTSAESIAAAVETVKAKTGGSLDILVNNAGSGYVTPYLDADTDKLRRMFETNVFGVHAVTKGFAPLVIPVKGSIVNICSIAGEVCAPFDSLYGASKGASTVISEGLRLELEPFGVKVVTVLTGVIQTEWWSNTAELELAPDSIYQPIRSSIETIANGGHVASSQPADVFAKNVVNDVLGGATGRIWRGASATGVKFLSTWVPQWAVDKLLRSFVPENGLVKLKQHVQEAEKKKASA